MSMSAIILTQSVNYHAELAERFGIRAANKMRFLIAARLIAGDYNN